MSSERPKSLNTIGLEIEGSTLKAVQLEQKKGKVRLLGLYAMALSGENSNPLSLTDRGKKLARELYSNLSLSAIATNETLIRPLFVQLKKDKDIDAVIEFQSEPIIPYPTSEAVIDWIKVAEEENGSHLSVYAVKKDHVQRHLEQWSQLGVEPENISVVPAALAAFANYCVAEESSYFVVHIAEETTSCCLIYKDKLLGAQSLHKGVKDLIAALPEEPQVSLDSLNFTNVDKGSYGKLCDAVDQLRLDLMKNILGLTKLLKGIELDKVLVTGPGAALSGLSQRLCDDLKKTLIHVEIPSEFECSQETLVQYSVPIGLALSGLPKIYSQIDLRKNELAYPRPWKRLIKPLAFYLLACLLLAWGAYMSGKASLGYKEDLLKEKFGSLLALMDKPYGSFEAEYESSQGTDALLSIEELTSDDLFDRLDYLNEELDKAPEPIALMPNTPRVSDVLAWLATHPNVVLVGDEKGVRKPLIRVESFYYNMMKRPEEKKRNNKYQVKVELEFTSPTPKLAREFHDALIEDNDFVDAKGEVKWSSNRGHYRTSFYLKDKTYYPVSTKN